MNVPLSQADVERVRALTPGCAHTLHFNHSGASLPSQGTVDAITTQLDREARGGPMEAGAQGALLQQSARQIAARLLNTTTDSIAFSSSGAAAWNMAFNALGPWREGDRILVGRQEWGGNLACMTQAVNARARVEVIPCDTHGAVSASALESMIDPRVRLISLTWLPANGGLINPAQAIGEIARRHGVPYFIDAGQALGQIAVDVQALQCDVLKGAARKFLRGPRGTALLYVRKAFLAQLQPVLFDVQSTPWEGGQFGPLDDARRFESSEVSMALLAGLNNALAEAEALGISRISARIAQLASQLRRGLSAIEGLTLHDLGAPGQQSGLIAFNVQGWSAMALKTRLAQDNINIAANGIPYTPLDMQARGLHSVARASVSYFTTEREIEVLVQALRRISVQG